VTADKPYAAPGDKVTFHMTYADSLDTDPDAGMSEPREVQAMWLGGCVNPLGDTYAGCFLQFQKVFQAIASGGVDPTGIFKQEPVAPELSGVPDALSFELSLPDDVLMGAKPTETDTVYSTAYLFFAVCAGKELRLAAADSGAGFPLECIDRDGKMLGADSFVAGYTQVFVFGDGRMNVNPPVMGMTLDGAAIEDDVEKAPVVPRCAPAATTGQPQGCGMPEAEDCTTFKIQAVVDDVAEVDPESSTEGAPVKEAVWVDYLTDGGAFAGAKKLINDPALGFRPDHATEWTPPGEAGLVSIWAVVHDARGGASVTRRVFRVE